LKGLDLKSFGIKIRQVKRVDEVFQGLFG